MGNDLKLSEKDLNKLLLLRRIFSSISISFSLFLLCFLIIKRKVKMFSNIMKIHLSLACLLYSIPFLFPRLSKVETLCKIQSLSFFSLDISCLFFTTFFSIAGFFSFVQGDNFDKFLCFWNMLEIFFGWILPIVYFIIGYFYAEVESDITQVCWKIHHFFLLSFFIIIIILFLVNIIFSFLLLYQLSKNAEKEEDKKIYLRYAILLISYIASQAIVNSLFKLDLIFILFNKDYFNNTLWFNCLRDIFRPLTGLIYTICFGYSNQIFKQLGNCFCCVDNKVDSINEEIESLNDFEDEDELPRKTIRNDSYSNGQGSDF